MAKKMVRGITDVKTINNQDFDTNNVNDLLSDGQYNYIHRKKGENEEYHNLTDNIKTISSDNTDLLTVTNNNKTTNTATLHPKHDAQKEQLLESTRNTVNIQHGTNGTAEKTTVDTNPLKVLEHENLISDSEYITLDHKTGENVTHIKTATLKEELTNLHQTKQDTLIAGTGITIQGQTIDTNPQKVLEHENLLTDYGISKSTTGNTTKLGLEYKRVGEGYDLNNLLNGRVRAGNFLNAPQCNKWFFVSAATENQHTIQRAINLLDKNNPEYVRIKRGDNWGEWREQVGDKSVIDGLLAQKQNKLTAMDGISITGDSIYLTTLNDYSEDLNNLTYTCTAKPIDNAPNLPTGVGGNGVLSVIRVGNVVSQTYHALDNNVYYRITNNSSSTFVWTPWVKLTTLAV